MWRSFIPSYLHSHHCWKDRGKVCETVVVPLCADYHNVANYHNVMVTIRLNLLVKCLYSYPVYVQQLSLLCRVVFNGSPDGEFWYLLHLNALNPKPVVLPDTQCELGR